MHRWEGRFRDDRHVYATISTCSALVAVELLSCPHAAAMDLARWLPAAEPDIRGAGGVMNYRCAGSARLARDRRVACAERPHRPLLDWASRRCRRPGARRFTWSIPSP